MKSNNIVFDGCSIKVKLKVATLLLKAQKGMIFIFVQYGCFDSANFQSNRTIRRSLITKIWDKSLFLVGSIWKHLYDTALYVDDLRKWQISIPNKGMYTAIKTVRISLFFLDWSVDKESTQVGQKSEESTRNCDPLLSILSASKNDEMCALVKLAISCLDIERWWRCHFWLWKPIDEVAVSHSIRIGT